MKRSFFLDQIHHQFSVHPIVGLIGPRQVGKTTLATQYADAYKGYYGSVAFFDLENPTHFDLLENPLLVFERQPGLIIIDEIQRKPDLFPVLRVFADKGKRFLILGSSSPHLIQSCAESLAGRMAYIELVPFSIDEVPDLKQLWIRGGYPRSYLSDNENNSFEWRRQYIKHFLERDIPALGISIPENRLRKFWMMLAHYHGQIVNYSEIGKSLQVKDATIRRYLDLLVGTFMVRELQPWHANISKRQVKSPKFYFKDSGILHFFLNTVNETQLESHPQLGSSWEGFLLETIIRKYNAYPEECYFWATQAQAELDLLIFKGGKKLGFEFKYSDRPQVTRSMQIALQDLGLDSLTVVYPGNENFDLGDTIKVWGVGSNHYNGPLP
ncbi:MAG: hypothetical protein A2Y14_01560 [Verrucomicrobia bacterium GWF2_51_19]|nr:MAG: hypothetical protein A2Y14_01560 [Verrucomicrobia bacterium GWF2_51_19]HCJ11654.1 hypothetical protein [Opitutae bacterium]